MRYLRYVIKNIEPIRIADDSTSQYGQTVTLKFIPGSAVRGLIVHALSKRADFNAIKKILFSNDIRYLNAYLCTEKEELFPSPKGFYEDKSISEGKKQIENVVIDGNFKEGLKRASLGKYAYIDKDTIYYYNVDTSSDLKIKINVSDKEDQNVFRNEYMTSGNLFTGYIAVEKKELEDLIYKIFEKDKIFGIGNARSAGLGKCKVLQAEYVARLPYETLLPKSDLENSCYMMLLSNLAMRKEDGELCGLNLKELERLMGVKELKIKYASTSTVNVKGYNRTWGMPVPSVMMYEQGSVFHLKYDGILTLDKMKQIADTGLGIRRNEGFGRVIFLDQYEQVIYKQAGKEIEKKKEAKAIKKKEDEDVLKLIAKNYYKNLINQKMQKYIVDHPIKKGTVKNSQLGKLMTLTTAYKYNPAEGEKQIKEHFSHAKEKEENRKTQKGRNSIKEFSKFVDEVLDADLDTLLEIEKKDTIMGIPKKELLTSDDIGRVKMKLLTELIRYDNKKGEE